MRDAVLKMIVIGIYVGVRIIMDDDRRQAGSARNLFCYHMKEAGIGILLIVLVACVGYSIGEIHSPSQES